MSGQINIRELALGSLLRFEREDVPLNREMQAVLSNYQYLDKQDRSIYSRICTGTVEWRIYLDHVLDRISRTPMKKCKPLIRNLLRMSAYQILLMDRIPDGLACDEAVSLAKKRGFKNLSGFVNGVLRNLVREKDKIELPDKDTDPVMFRSVKYSMPEWLVEEISSQYTPEIADKIFAAFLEDSPLTARIRKGTDRDELLNELAKENVDAKPALYVENAIRLTNLNYIKRIGAFREGRITIQDESSILQGFLIPNDCGYTVLDLCAAPGGKSLHAAERVGKDGFVLARDLTDAKVSLIEENKERMRTENLLAETFDATVFDKNSEEKYDLVIADLPCSGLGVIGRKPDIKYRLKKEQTDELVNLQREILKQAYSYIKPGGYLLYSTCTLNKKENAEQVLWLEDEFQFNPVSIKDRLPESLKKTLINQPETDLEGGYLTLIPGMQECDGFFMALFQKKK